MNTTITTKIQIIVPKEYKNQIDETLKKYSEACNEISEYSAKTNILSQSELNRVLYYNLRAKYGLPSQMTQSCIKTVISAYAQLISTKKLFDKCGNKRIPKFNPQISLVWNKDYSIPKKQNIGRVLSLSTISGRIKVKFICKGFKKYFNNNPKYKYGTANLVKISNKYFLHIPVSFEVPKILPDNIKNIVGIDRGIRFLATTYDSKGNTKFYSGGKAKNIRAKYKYLRTKLQRKHTKSSLRRLRNIGKRETRWISNENHKISKALVKNNPNNTCFVLEDLKNIRNATTKVRKGNKYILVSWPYYQLQEYLEYKAKLHGDLVIYIDPHYTSQICPKCGHLEKSNRNHDTHAFTCKSCGYSSNDDRIGAMNIFRKGLEKISKLQ